MAEKKEEKQAEKEQSDSVELVQVTASTAPAYQLPDGTILQPEEFLAWIGKTVYEIKKNIS